MVESVRSLFFFLHDKVVKYRPKPLLLLDGVFPDFLQVFQFLAVTSVLTLQSHRCDCGPEGLIIMPCVVIAN